MVDQKDTIYIDIDDEITAIIDKVRASPGKVVALVLPKRAATLQSIVNMKLLKRAVEEERKNVVLITTEAGLLPLAGAVGLHVAKTPSSRPEIPRGPEPMIDREEQVDEDMDLSEEDDTPLDKAASVGALSGGAAATMPLPAKPKADSGIETLELDNAVDEPKATPAFSKSAPTKKPKKDHHLAVPDFDRFKMFLGLGVLLIIVLVVGGYWAFAIAPKATIDIKTNASNVNTNVNFTLSTSAQSLSESSKVMPAKLAQTQKTFTGTANATGQQNNGDKAAGSINMTAGSCSGTVPSDVPAGTGVSTGGKTYITQEATSFVPTLSHNKCTFVGSDATSIKAQSGGSSYNVSNATFKVNSQVSATGSTEGGTDDIQTVVSQADIDSAKGKIDADNDAGRSDLNNQLQGQGLYAITATYKAGDPTITTSANAGDPADNVTVTEVITYSMFGVNQDDINTLVDNNIKSQIDTTKQGILSRGVSQGGFKATDIADSGASINLQTTAEVGPSIDTASIAKNAAGEKAGDIKSDVSADPDVTDVSVKLSPFWVNKAPKNTSKITVNVAKPTQTADAD